MQLGVQCQRTRREGFWNFVPARRPIFGRYLLSNINEATNHSDTITRSNIIFRIGFSCKYFNRNRRNSRTDPYANLIGYTVVQ